METIFDTFPVFEANQVLTSGHLNDLFDYLDQQARQTRSHLIGIGIVCGFELGLATSPKTTITLTKGCGVTSEGYLIVEPKDVALTAYRSYNLPAEIDYSPFGDASNNPYALWELFEDGTPNTTPLDGTFLNGKAMLLFLELSEASLSNCSPNNCDDKGSEVTVTVRRLLIATSDLDKIVAAAAALDSGLTSADIDAVLSARLNLPDLAAGRFDVPATGLVTTNDVYAAFLKVFSDQDLGTTLAATLGAAYKAFQPIVAKAYPADPFTTFAAHYGFLEAVPTDTTQIKFLQYYYDLFADLLRAYDEFRWKGVDLVCACCPDDGLFPRHLMIGIPLTPATPGNYRQGWLPSPAIGDCADETTEVVQLFTRLVEMAARFTNTPTLPKASPNAAIDPQIQVTPSLLGRAPLADRAIPYYYAQNGTPPLYQLWSPQKTARKRANQNLCYYNSQFVPTPAFYYSDPLRYDLEPYDFLRVEGHLGKGYAQVLTSLLNLKAQYRLPIDIIALRTGAYDDTIAVDPAKESAQFQDLDALYESLFGDLQLVLTEGVMELYDTPVPNLKTAGGTPKLPLLKTYAPNYRTTAGTIGAWYESYISRFEGTPYIDVDQNNITDQSVDLQVYCPMFTGTTGLLSTQYAYAVSVYYLSKLSETMPGTIETLAFADFQNKYQDLIALVRYFRALDATGVSPTLADFVPVAELLDICEGILFSCKLGGIGAVYAEYSKRLGALKKQQFLSAFLENHPGIRHKAGVPMGGTFILVYHELPATGGNVAAGKLGFAQGDDLVFSNVNDAVLSQAEQTVLSNAAGTKATGDVVAVKGPSETREEKLVLSPRLDETQASGQLDDIIGRVSADPTLSSNADVLTLINALRGGFGIRHPAGGTKKPALTIDDIIATAIGELGEQAVIADFYLPYRVSCDGPAIQFVLPKPMPSFTAQVGCAGSAGTAPVTITAKGGMPSYDIAVDGGAYQALGSDPLQLAPGSHTLMLRDSDSTETPSQTITVATTLVIGTPAYACDNGNFTATGTIGGGTAPYSVNGAPSAGATYATAPTASGANVAITVTDANGCSASQSFTHTCPPPCTLPCGGIMQQRKFRLWIPDPDPNDPYKSFKLSDLAFTVESSTGKSVDLSSKVRTILTAKPADLTPAGFPNLVATWIKKLNALIAETPGLFETGKAQWLGFTYTSLGAGRFGELQIAHFDCLKFNISIASVISRALSVGGAENLIAAYTPGGTAINMGSLSIAIPAYDGTVTDRCAGTPATQICTKPKTQLSIVANIAGSALSLTGSAAPPDKSLTYLWEVVGAQQSLGNGAAFATQLGQQSQYAIWLTAFTSAGCSVTTQEQITHNVKS
ncbi:MAG TPA: hypothetical protein VG387_15680 [Rhizomicrobium sp.]|jgi:hypothetical protein|nr:hypothetical protein [Rhizomicrobium sp.]